MIERTIDKFSHIFFWRFDFQVHATRDTKLLARTAFTCPQCRAKIQELPADCVVCGLKLVLSPHLARSFHHLFPVAPFTELKSLSDNQKDDIISSSVIPSFAPSSKVLDSKLRLSTSQETTSCFACLRLIGVSSQTSNRDGVDDEGEEILRYRCPECQNVFCVNCDSYLHDALHNCPGCLQLTWLQKECYQSYFFAWWPINWYISQY